MARMQPMPRSPKHKLMHYYNGRDKREGRAEMGKSLLPPKRKAMTQQC